MRTWPINFLRAFALAGVASFTSVVLPTTAVANGEFLQVDVAPGASSVTGTVRRGRVTLSLGWSEFEVGHATTVWGNYGFPLAAGAWLRLGPSLRIDNTSRVDLGLRAGVERFSMGERTTMFLLAEFNTVQREYLALGQIGHRGTGIAGEISLQGGRAGFRERSIAMSYRLGESPARLRIGYRFNARRIFAGFTINTF